MEAHSTKYVAAFVNIFLFQSRRICALLCSRVGLRLQMNVCMCERVCVHARVSVCVCMYMLHLCTEKNVPNSYESITSQTDFPVEAYSDEVVQWYS